MLLGLAMSMDKILRPERLDLDVKSTNAEEDYNHWIRTFENFLEAVTKSNDEADKLKVLTNFVTPKVYHYIADCDTFESAKAVLQSLFIKKKNTVCARYILLNQKQNTSETISDYVASLKQLTRDCDFKQVTAQQYREEMLLNAFVGGLVSDVIRQRLLEEDDLTFDKAVTSARAQELAQRNNKCYQKNNDSHFVANVSVDSYVAASANQSTSYTPNNNSQSKKERVCYFCGGYLHKRRSDCPAWKKECGYCHKMNHFETVCLEKKKDEAAKRKNNTVSAILPSSSSEYSPMLATLNSHEAYSSPVLMNVLINNLSVTVLADTGSTLCFISLTCAKNLGLCIKSSNGVVKLADSSKTSTILGEVITSITFNDHVIENVCLYVLQSLAADVIIGADVLKLFESVAFHFGGDRPALHLNAVQNNYADKTDHPRLFQFLSPDCKPIATPRRSYSRKDFNFMKSQVLKLLNSSKIRKSNSPWRAQALVVENTDGKDRMVIDYSRTINKFTHLDSYPLPKIDDIVNEVAKFKFISKLDLKSAYHQVQLHPDDIPYTAFQVGNELYEWLVMPPGITNAVPIFQRIANDFVEKHRLQGHVFPYLDDWGVGGDTQEEHDQYLAKTLAAAESDGLVLNEKKCVFNQSEIHFLGHLVGNGMIKPDPDRVRDLLDIPVPRTKKQLQRAIGIFAYYAKWLYCYSDTVRPLLDTVEFPLSREAETSFNTLKSSLAEVSLQAIDFNAPFVVETDASDVASAGILNQSGKPVAFHSRTFSENEKHLPSVEKEALAIVDCVRKWRHFLAGTHFQIITDQRSVSYIFNIKHTNKIKSEKLGRWRLELSTLSYDVIYRPGSENKGADALSRAFCSSTAGAHNLRELTKLHINLFHPGTQRFYHFVKAKNLPYTLDNVKEVIHRCSECAHTKPQFCTSSLSDGNHLIKALHPMDRLNLDFKGPLPSISTNRYMLNIVDEYSRYMWSYPCTNVTAKTVIKCLTELFSTFGLPNYIHSDRGSSLISEELTSFLHKHGIATSRTTRYNPAGNGQIEKYNGVLWKSITATLSSHNLPDSHWESVLFDALHAQRSLLCTATNATPHERIFSFPRKSSAGCSMPSWLKPGPILVKRHVRNKYDPLVDEAELLEVTPSYGTVRLNDGRELNVSLRDLAPAPLPSPLSEDSDLLENPPAENEVVSDAADNSNAPDSADNTNDQADLNDDLAVLLQNSTVNPSGTNVDLPSASEFHGSGWVRRSERASKPVKKFGT